MSSSGVGWESIIYSYDYISFWSGDLQKHLLTFSFLPQGKAEDLRECGASQLPPLVDTALVNPFSFTAGLCCRLRRVHFIIAAVSLLVQRGEGFCWIFLEVSITKA